MIVNYRAIPLLSHYKEIHSYEREMLPVVEKTGDGTISLPLYPKLSNDGVQYVTKEVKEVAASQAKLIIWSCPIREPIKGGVRWTTCGLY